MDQRELKLPMEPRAVVFHFSKFLTDFEKQEILDYDIVYFIPTDPKKMKKIQQTPSGPENNGFDNDKQEYIVIQGGHIAYRYEILS